MSHVVVVGAGVAGLTAARFLARAGVRVTVLEGASRIGGKLRVSEIAGLPVDEGAESMLARRPEGLDLVQDLGWSDRLVQPATTSAAIYSRGALRPMPAGNVMGVPTDLRALAASGILSPAGLARAPLDLALPRTLRGGDDISVGGYIGGRVGREIVDRLVEPLLGGVYAGRADELSLKATLPGIAAVARKHRSLIAAVRSVRGTAPKDAGPMFVTFPDGLGTLPNILADAISADGGEVRTRAMVEEVTRDAEGRWRLVIGSTAGPRIESADGVVVAAPAGPASRLLADVVPAAALELARIEYASIAIVTLVYASTAFPRRPANSGYLVPAVENRQVKAVSFSSVKWPHLAERDPDLMVVRCSLGRRGEEHLLQRSDAELTAAAVTELAQICGIGEMPLDSRLTRWGGGLPQYTVGHAERVARIRSAVAGCPGLALAGAAYDGVGIPGCISSGRAAATQILEYVNSRGERHVSDSETEGARS